MTLKPRKKLVRRVASASRPMHRVLYVEDEDVNWTVATIRLSANYELVRARDAKEMFEQIRSSGPFALILLDVQLQGSDYDGINLARILRGNGTGEIPDYARGVQLDAATPIFFVTGSHHNEELSDAGSDRIFAKPVDFTNLALAMARHISRASSARD